VVAAAMGSAAFSVDEAPCRFSAPRKRRIAPGRGGAPVLGGSHSPHQVDRIAISIEGSAGAGAMRGRRRTVPTRRSCDRFCTLRRGTIRE
jgi:hypothetical protein